MMLTKDEEVAIKTKIHEHATKLGLKARVGGVFTLSTANVAHVDDIVKFEALCEIAILLAPGSELGSICAAFADHEDLKPLAEAYDRLGLLRKEGKKAESTR